MSDTVKISAFFAACFVFWGTGIVSFLEVASSMIHWGRQLSFVDSGRETFLHHPIACVWLLVFSVILLVFYTRKT